MKQDHQPGPRLPALPADASPDLKEAFQTYVKALGFVPNSVLIMQRKPKMVKALSQLAAAVWDPESEVPVEVGEKHLAKTGWNVGKHARRS